MTETMLAVPQHRVVSLLLSLCLFISVASGSAFVAANPPFYNRLDKSNEPSSTRRFGSTLATLEIGDFVGSGSYGTVHLGRLGGDLVIAKRAWTLEELEKNDDCSHLDTKALRERQERCQYHWGVEQHCFEKLGSHPQLVRYLGTFLDTLNREWLTFDLIEDVSSSKENLVVAKTLSDVMKLELDASNDHPHHLYQIGKALGLKSASDTEGFEQTLDTIMLSMLQVLTYIHSKEILHRDLKTSNFLIDSTSKSLVLMDFGSAADLEPTKGLLPFQTRRVGLEDSNRAAVTPLYAAPEVFVDPKKNPKTFDVFSAALVFLQLAFQFFDERTEAGFVQQFRSADWDLDTWLDQEALLSKVRPSYMEGALQYFGRRRGLWRLLGDMTLVDPRDRIESKQALKRFQQICQGTCPVGDSRFFESVIQSLDVCEVLPPDLELASSRALHYVASFSRSKSLGLLLAEADGDVSDLDNKEDLEKWKTATANALPGQVFVKGVVEGSQAEELGVFEIGDRVQGVGELPLVDGGFEQVLKMLEEQPRNAKYIKLHFDRFSSRNFSSQTIRSDSTPHGPITIVDQGAWSTKGRRQSQEDAFVLHDLHDGQNRDILIAGVLDGHAGKAASQMISDRLPESLAQQLISTESLEEALQTSWDMLCDEYRSGCTEELCLAEYDTREGVLDGNTGSQTLAAGTTASVVAVDETCGLAKVLNCGDSRSLLVDSNGGLCFVTNDHTPQAEQKRLREGREMGLNYSEPQCSMSRWWLTIGDFRYNVARSLEGNFATERGIVSTPDVYSLQLESGMTVVVATDGLWEVMDSEEVAHAVGKMRKKGMDAGDCAKTLCSMALQKSTSDNVSAVVVYVM